MSRERLLPFHRFEGDYDEKSTLQSMCHKLVKFWTGSLDFSKKALEMGRKDPRKIIYAIKSGFALACVSLFIFWNNPLADVSQFAIWAILTVIVMFEFSIGATFIKGFNRGLGTFCAGMLAFLFAELALLSGDQWEKVVIVISFFIIGSIASYLKLYPTMAPYEYGFRVFVLTYCILMVAGNRTREYTAAIFTRLVLIAVGACICFIVNVSIYPIWSGDDLHNLVVNNFKDLATSLEGCVNGYLKCVDNETPPTRFSTQASEDQLFYKSVIDSATREKTLLGFAIWEPPHGRYKKFGHPWTTYVKVSAAVRHCAYTVMALHGCTLSEIQAPPEKRQVFRSQLQSVSAEGARVLRQLGGKIKKMEKLGTSGNILKQVHEAGEQLQRKIDQRSFLLVNSGDREFRDPSKHLEDLPSEMEPKSDQYLGFRSQSETAIYLHSSLKFANNDLTAAEPQNLRQLVPWPSWISLEGVDLIKEDEVKTYQSASALSLATFASLLIEFVARLQNVVDCFEELSEEAGFVDPDIVLLEERRFGLWTRLFRCFGFKSS